MASAGFVCGYIELGMPQPSLWTALPAEILIRKCQAGEILSWLLQLIIKESANPRFGGSSIIERLCDSIFVLVLRHCMEENLTDKGVFLAMQDDKIEPALTMIHREPGRPWTLDSLCSLAGLSRTAFSNRFTELVGCPPIEYLTTWRMQTAASLLSETRMTIEDVAECCGYQSVSAFSKAFKRVFAVAPGSFRHRGPRDGVEHS
ncbi:MAG: AraC family transcriptional regulator [Methylococcus sp.]|nr:AraC family transcriptional regulator [Methylococcus sp.]